MYSQLSACIRTAFDIPNSLEKGIMVSQAPPEVINYINLSSVLAKMVSNDDLLSFRSYTKDQHIWYISIIIDDSFFNNDEKYCISYMYYKSVPTAIVIIAESITDKRYRLDVSDSNPMIPVIDSLIKRLDNFRSGIYNIDTDPILSLTLPDNYNGMFAVSITSRLVLIVDTLLCIFGDININNIIKYFEDAESKYFKDIIILKTNSTKMIEKFISYCSTLSVEELLDNSSIVGDMDIFKAFMEGVKISYNDKNADPA